MLPRMEVEMKREARDIGPGYVLRVESHTGNELTPCSPNLASSRRHP